MAKTKEELAAAEEKEAQATETKKTPDGKKDEKREEKKTETARRATRCGKTGVESNTKALDFQEFLVDNNINVFSTESLEDEYQTVMFRSRIEAKGQILPMAILIDTSLFTIIRTQIVTGITADKRPRLEHYLNELNTQYKIFKYYLRDDGVIYLDICLPYVDETFDSKMIQLMLSILVQHLEASYDDLMAEVWKKA